MDSYRVKIHMFGSIYIDGNIAPIGCSAHDSRIAIGNSVDGKRIGWLQVGDNLVADHCVCFNVSWDTLHKQRYDTGVFTRIDGKPYLCRLPQLGVTENAANEWSTALKETTQDDTVWHWKEGAFWGKELRPELDLFAATRSWDGKPLSHRFSLKSYAGPTIGFRPVMEPLRGEVEHPEKVLGNTVMICVSNMIVSGFLVDANDYDVAIIPDNKELVPGIWGCWQQVGSQNRLVVDRNAIQYIGGWAV